MIEAVALPPLPEIEAGDDLAELIVKTADREIADRDVLVIAQKVVSKAEGRTVDLKTVTPSSRAEELSNGTDRDPRVVEVILSESRSIIRANNNVLVCETHHGFVCANAGVDQSNTGADERVVLLPIDPDRSARELRASFKSKPAVVITDSFGRAWRNGQCEVAIGCAGLLPIDDLTGNIDSDGRTLSASAPALADQVAATSDLTRTKTSRQPVVVVTGLSDHITVDDGPGAAALLRAQNEDLFR